MKNGCGATRGIRAPQSITRNQMWHPDRPIRHPLPETRWPSREEADAAILFTPIRVGQLTLESRTWVPAMVPWRATEDGFVTRNILDWYARFAEGRPGAIVVE